MFWNKTKQSPFSTDIAVMERPTYPTEVVEIHTEFHEAGDKLLAEAQAILNCTKRPDDAKVNLLKSFGFNRVQEVADYQIVSDKISKQESILRTVNEMRIKYPTKRIITEDQIKSICDKWNLVFGDVDQFKGFVPKKNLQEINDFMSKYNNKVGIWVNGMFLENCEVRTPRGYYHIYQIGTDDYILQSDDGIRFYGSFYSGKNEYLKDLNNKLLEVSEELINDSRFIRNAVVQKSPLKICAPIKDMDTKGYKLDGHKLIKHVPDPVVLFPIENNMYVIVTAWGDEASDENVVNHQMN